MKKWLEERIAEAAAERQRAIDVNDDIAQAYWGGRHSAYEAALRELHLRFANELGWEPV